MPTELADSQATRRSAEPRTGCQENPIGKLLQLGVQLVVQELLERETAEQLGRGHYQHRRPDEPLRGLPDTGSSAGRA